MNKCNERFLSTANSTFLGYVGAAILGLVLSNVFYLITMGSPFLALLLYGVYTFCVLLLSALCNDISRGENCGVCALNEFWITLENIIQRKSKN